MNRITEKLRNEPIYWSRLGMCLNPVAIGGDGLPILLNNDFDKLLESHRQMYGIGVKIHTTVMQMGWIGIDKYDYTLCDKVLDLIFSLGDDICYIPRVKLEPPLDWCKENPMELFLYEDAPREESDIKALVGSLKHDLYGIDSPNGYAILGGAGKTKNRPNMNGVIGMESFASEKWRKDAGEALKRFVQHLENSKYAGRIIGYQIGFGNCGENFLWGSWEGNSAEDNWNKRYRLGDYSACALNEFYKWGMHKYNTDEQLKKVWGSDAPSIPSVKERMGETNDITEFFRGRKKDIICSDYTEFLGDTVVSALEYFSSIIKCSSQNKAVGTFYGYVVGVANASNGGHTRLSRLLECPDIDFVSAPKGYYKAGVGMPGAEQAAMQSVGLKKLWIDEVDNPTHIMKYKREAFPKNTKETMQLLWREYAKNLSHNQGFWWMDLAGGFYDDAELLTEMKKIVDLNSELRKKQGIDNLAEVLIVADDSSLNHMRLSYGVYNHFVIQLIAKIKQCGFPVDLFRLDDLDKLDLKRYKIIFFLDCFKIDDNTRKLIMNGFNKGATMVWNYASGIIKENESDFSFTHSLTGFKLKLMPNSAEFCEKYKAEIRVDFPLIAIDDECEALLELDKNCIIGRKNYNGFENIMCCLPFLEIEDLSEIIEKSGCHRYAPTGCTVYGDSRFLLVVPDAKREKLLVSLKNECNFEELMTGKHYLNCRELNCDVDNGDVVFIKYE